MTSWSDFGRVLTTGHHFVIYHGTLPGDLICDKCARVVLAGGSLDGICPGPDA